MLATHLTQMRSSGIMFLVVPKFALSFHAGFGDNRHLGSSMWEIHDKSVWNIRQNTGISPKTTIRRPHNVRDNECNFVGLSYTWHGCRPIGSEAKDERSVFFSFLNCRHFFPLKQQPLPASVWIIEPISTRNKSAYIWPWLRNGGIGTIVNASVSLATLSGCGHQSSLGLFDRMFRLPQPQLHCKETSIFVKNFMPLFRNWQYIDKNKYTWRQKMWSKWLIRKLFNCITDG